MGSWQEISIFSHWCSLRRNKKSRNHWTLLDLGCSRYLRIQSQFTHLQVKQCYLEHHLVDRIAMTLTLRPHHPPFLNLIQQPLHFQNLRLETPPPAKPHFLSLPVRLILDHRLVHFQSVAPEQLVDLETTCEMGILTSLRLVPVPVDDQMTIPFIHFAVFLVLIDLRQFHQFLHLVLLLSHPPLLLQRQCVVVE